MVEVIQELPLNDIVPKLPTMNGDDSRISDVGNPVGMCAWHESESLRLDNRTSPELRGPLVCILITSLALTTAHSPGDQIRTSIKAIESVGCKEFVIVKGFADGSEKMAKK